MQQRLQLQETCCQQQQHWKQLLALLQLLLRQPWLVFVHPVSAARQLLQLLLRRLLYSSDVGLWAWLTGLCRTQWLQLCLPQHLTEQQMASVGLV